MTLRPGTEEGSKAKGHKRAPSVSLLPARLGVLVVVIIVMAVVLVTGVGIDGASGRVTLGGLTHLLKAVDAFLHLSGNVLLLAEIMVGNHTAEGRHTRGTRACPSAAGIEVGNIGKNTRAVGARWRGARRQRRVEGSSNKARALAAHLLNVMEANLNLRREVVVRTVVVMGL